MNTTLTPEAKESLRSERLEARISKVQKDYISVAAALRGQNVTEFVVNSAVEAAERTVQLHEAFTLSQRDRETFVAALLNPPQPSDSLKRAVQRHRAHVER